MPIDERLVVMASSRRASTPGIMKSRLSSRELNQTRTRGSIAAAVVAAVSRAAPISWA